MKLFGLLLICFFGLNANAQQVEIENTVKTFFDGCNERDTTKVKSVCHHEMIFKSILEGEIGVKLEEEITSDSSLSFASLPENMKFKIKKPSCKIQTDGTVANAWTPYEFYVSGKLHHSGVCDFTLSKKNDAWKIIYIIDTRRKSIK